MVVSGCGSDLTWCMLVRDFVVVPDWLHVGCCFNSS